MGTQLLIREQLSQDEVDNIYVENANETQEGSGQQEQIIESSVENENVTQDARVENEPQVYFNDNENETQDTGVEFEPVITDRNMENETDGEHANEQENESDDSEYRPEEENGESDSDVSEMEEDVSTYLEGHEIDNDQLDSGSESDDYNCSRRKRKLRSIRNKNQNSSPFYLGQVFGTKEEVKALIKENAVKTKRQIKIVKDEARRVRAVCLGDIPKYQGNESDEANVGVGSSNTSKDKGPNDKHLGGRGKKKDPLDHFCPWKLLVSKEKRSESWH
ncbi:hypothetical protein QVD17_10410 [Tagetes erecta]|uniref:Uncharacterized protein n=1 Tax=Tagetes erecta TaxID=13708 RepID=A0AAD8L105_TARER|nr:hypothetical protein QVD17_10410 [Tagetes erecta]